MDWMFVYTTKCICRGPNPSVVAEYRDSASKKGILVKWDHESRIWSIVSSFSCSPPTFFSLSLCYLYLYLHFHLSLSTCTEESCNENQGKIFASQGEGSYQKLNELKPWSLTSMIQNYEKTNVHCLSHQSMVFCYYSLPHPNRLLSIVPWLSPQLNYKQSHEDCYHLIWLTPVLPSTEHRDSTKQCSVNTYKKIM